jgi:hypothetical protein
MPLKPLEFIVRVTTLICMAEQKYHKSEIATEQLQTAIFLFLNGYDLSSVITLAGAAGAILERLVRNEGKTPFIDYACNVYNVRVGSMPPRTKYNHQIKETLGINPHKHMSPDCPDTLEIDLKKSAVGAIVMAVRDYTTLYGQDHDFIKGYLRWGWANLDGPQMMKDYEDLPAKVKNYGRAKLPKA